MEMDEHDDGEKPRAPRRLRNKEESDRDESRRSRPKRRDEFDEEEVRDEPNDQSESSSRQNRRPTYPVLVSIAGWIWIADGSLILLGILYNIVGSILTLRAIAPIKNIQYFYIGMFCASIFFGLIGAFFIRFGIRCVKGDTSDTLGVGIGSICISLLFFAVSLLPSKTGGGLIYTMIGTAYFFPGILALVARKRFLQWKNRPKVNRKNRKRIAKERESGN